MALFWRDKRISDVIRERAYDPSFGSIAIVRRAGLDLRNNLKFMSYGHLNVLRVEVMQLLDEAFRILDAEDIKKQFGADTAWDVIENILVRYFNERLVTSPRQRMAVAGREVLRWLAQPHVLQAQRAQFEALLLQIAEYAEEWLTSAAVARPDPAHRRPASALPIDRGGPARPIGPVGPRAAGRRGHAPTARGGERRWPAMIIDGHCHAGRGERLTAPWNTAAPLGAYLRRARAAGIDRTVVFAPFDGDYRIANAEVARIVARHPGRLIGFACVHPNRDAGRVRALVGRAVREWGFRGIKVHRLGRAGHPRGLRGRRRLRRAGALRRRRGAAAR